MERYETEEQQVEAIKQFWKDHGAAIIIGAVLGLGGLWGWRYYSESQITSQEDASLRYQEAIETLATDDTAKLTQFAKDEEAAGYKTIANLVAAQQAAEEGDFDAAANHLNTVVSESPDAHIASIASLRLARVQIEMNQLDAALSTLGEISDKAFDAEVQEIKGDIFVRQAKFDDARMAYTSALEKSTSNRLLQMKLDNLAVAAGA